MTLYRVGKVLTYLGVLAWVPYFYLEYVKDAHPPFFAFLAAHLSGVIPGGILSVLGRRQLKKRSSDANTNVQGSR